MERILLANYSTEESSDELCAELSFKSTKAGT
jgi:hypothetical protein